MPAAAVIGAVGAIAVAAEVGTVFAVVAAVGATVGAVGAVTGVKELQWAGLALGAVGAVGGIASSAGLFAGEAAGSLGQVATDAGSWAGAGAEAVSAAAAPAGGYTMEALANSGLATAEGLPGAMAAAGEAATIAPTTDIVDLVNSGASNFNELPITKGIETPSTTIPEILPETTVSPVEPTVEPVVDPAGEFPGQGLQTSSQYMVEAPSGLVDSPVPTDQFGQPMQIGDAGSGSGDLGGGVTNPAANNTVTSLPDANAPPQPPAAPEAVKVTGVNPGAEANVSGIPKGMGPQGPTGGALMPTNVADSPSIWSSILKFAKENQTLTMGGLMAAGQFLSGAMSPLTPAQVAALDAQAANNLAAANLARSQDELLQLRLENMRQPIPVANRRPRAPAGLIQSGGVTGAPA